MNSRFQAGRLSAWTLADEPLRSHVWSDVVDASLSQGGFLLQQNLQKL